MYRVSADKFKPTHNPVRQSLVKVTFLYPRPGYPDVPGVCGQVQTAGPQPGPQLNQLSPGSGSVPCLVLLIIHA